GLRRGVRLTTMIDFEVGFSEAVVEEVVLNLPGTVARADDEVVKAEAIVPAHDVKQDRLAGDLDHRRRSKQAFLGHSRAESPGENEDGNLRGFGGGGDFFHARNVALSRWEWRRLMRRGSGLKPEF